MLAALHCGNLDLNCQDCQNVPYLKESRGCELPTQIAVWEDEEIEYYRCPKLWLTYQVLNWYDEYKACKDGLCLPEKYGSRQARWYEAVTIYEKAHNTFSIDKEKTSKTETDKSFDILRNSNKELK